MNRLRGAATLLVLGFLFLVANRAAYRGYFQDDDFDNIAKAHFESAGGYLAGLATTLLSPVNFRPVGNLLYRALEAGNGLRYESYIAAIHVLHLACLVLLWFVLRHLSVAYPARVAATVFWGFHMALFAAYWHPMYLYDVLCGVFCLAALLSWQRHRWLLTFVCCWLAYKSKELAVVLPLVLAAYEWLLGERRWRELVPALLITLIFGTQALLFNPRQQTDYAFHFGPGSLAQTAKFYGASFFLVPIGILALLPIIAAGRRDRRVWFGLVWLGVLLSPLLLLADRLNPVYLYVPLIGLAIAVGSVLSSPRAAWLAVLIWIPLNVWQLRLQRPVALARMAENRAYVAELRRVLPDRAVPISAVLYDGAPVYFNPWGIEGAVRYLRNDPRLHMLPAESPAAAEAALHQDALVLTWRRADRKILVARHDPAAGDASRIEMNAANPVWQFGPGWYTVENGFRWTKPNATVRLARPAKAGTAFVTIFFGPRQRQDQPETRIDLAINGQRLGFQRLTDEGRQTLRWPLPKTGAGSAQVTIFTEPPYVPASDPRVLGVAVVAVGLE